MPDQPTPPRAPETGRGIDHVVLATADLDRARDSFARLGFTLTPKALHPFGTGNSLVQLQGAFLELLAVVDPTRIAKPAPGGFSFAGFNRDFLRRHQGLSMLVLESRHAERDLADFRAAGLTTFPRFDFERLARQPDGEERTVAFSLAFTAAEAAPDVGFFTCLNRFPENFWQHDYQFHANTAETIEDVVMVAPDPADYHAFLGAFTGLRAIRSTSRGIEIQTPRGKVSVLTPAAFRQWFGADTLVETPATLRLMALTIGVRDLGQAAATLIAGGFTVADRGHSLVVAPREANGAVMAFAPRSMPT